MKRVFAFLALCTALMVMLCACGGKTEPPTWQEQYDLGVRYLEEGNYEEAILAFTAAIEIDPKQAEAYVGRGDAYAGYAQTLTEGKRLSDEALEAYENAVDDYKAAIKLDKSEAEVYQKAAEVYIILGDLDAATKILEKGLRVTEDQSLQDSLDELAGVVTVDELTEGSAEWQALEVFLSYFGWYGEYDSTTVTEPNWKSQNALENFLTVASCYCYDDTLYPGEALLIDWEHPDPLNKWDFMNSHGRASADKIDWLLKNIFNCDPKDIEDMKKPILAEQNDEIYYLNGNYYFFVGGIGGGYEADVTHVEQVGKRYYVEYDLYNFYDEQPVKYCALMSLKSIDGQEYWSLYYCRELKNMEQNGEAPQLTGNEVYGPGIALGTEEIERLSEEIAAYYNEQLQPIGVYVCFPDECEQSDEQCTLILRYVMSNEEAEERIANGGMPAANIYTSMVWVNKQTGEVTDEILSEPWYIELP